MNNLSSMPLDKINIYGNTHMHKLNKTHTLVTWTKKAACMCQKTAGLRSVMEDTEGKDAAGADLKAHSALGEKGLDKRVGKGKRTRLWGQRIVRDS